MNHPYPIGTPGQPWGAEEIAQWRSGVARQRSYADDVLGAIAPLRRDFDVSEYGALDYDGQHFPLLAIRSRNRIDWALLTQACADADIVVSDRRLPRGCRPRWLKLDRQSLAYTGGVAIYLGQTPYVSTVAGRIGQHPWAQ